MSTTPLAVREAVMGLLATGLTPFQVSRRLNYSLAYVYQARADTQENRPPPRPKPNYAPWTPPDLNAEARQEALDRGRALALAKVAAGEWVLPSGEGVGG